MNTVRIPGWLVNPYRQQTTIIIIIIIIIIIDGFSVVKLFRALAGLF